MNDFASYSHQKLLVMPTNTLIFKSIKKGDIKILLINQTNLFIVECDYNIAKADFIEHAKRPAM